MDISNWINVALFVVSLVALGAAVSQARTARRAQTEAVKASEAAGEHERAALLAAEDSAASLASTSAATERVARAIEDAQRVWTPWAISSLGGGHHRWVVVNMTGHRVSANLSFPHTNVGHILTPGTGRGLFREVGPGESIEFTWERRGPGARKDARVRVDWFLPSGGMQVSEGTAIIPD